ncbi:MAG: hypothetical protein FJ245_05880 [Nitrospira sp.]|nr:hypothetical protein [Nitrospira sp.]
MKSTPIIIGTMLMLTLSGAIGCAATTPAEPSALQQSMTPQAHDLAFQYKRQATALREIAQRYELEAQVLARLKGAQHAETLHSLDLAKSLLAEADEADSMAREYRRQIPHNRVY